MATCSQPCRGRICVERGAILIHVAIAIFVLMAFSAWVIEGGVMWNARAQAQSAADAGALAGAIARAYDESADPPSAGGKTVNSINSAVAANPIWNATVTPAISWTCPASAFPGASATGCVRVDVTRTGIPVYVTGMLGIASQQVRATATAQAVDANTAHCMRPWMIPDKWGGPNQTTYVAPPDFYVPPSAGPASMTGYQPTPAFIGLQTTLHTGNPHDTIAPSDYYDVDIGSGVSGFVDAISGATCPLDAVTIGQQLTTQPGRHPNQNHDGAQALIARDSGAHWDTTCNCVAGSAFAVSPRIVPIAAFSPAEFAGLDRQSGRIQLTVVNLLAFFVESAPPGGDVTGRFVNNAGILVPGGGATAGTSFLKVISLVR